MRMSDLVTARILEILERGGGIAEIKRNELAAVLGCVPSQINYVITSRFTPEQGYLVESRRGGGGYIRIRAVNAAGDTALMHVVNSIGNELDASGARALLEGMLYRGLLSKNEVNLMAAALLSKSLVTADVDADRIRADLLKNMLLSLL